MSNNYLLDCIKALCSRVKALEEGVIGDDWGGQVVIHDDTLTGTGVSGDELSVVFPPQPPVVVDGVTITGTGLTGSPLVAVGGGGGPALPARVSQGERQAWYDNALSANGDVRLWTPSDVVDTIEYRTGFRLVRNPTELSDAISDASIYSIRVSGEIAITSPLLLSRPMDLHGLSYNDRIVVSGDTHAIEIRASDVSVRKLHITADLNTENRAIVIARNGAHKNLLIDGNKISSIGDGIYCEGTGIGDAEVYVSITNNFIEDIRRPITMPLNSTSEGFGIYLLWNVNSVIKNNRIDGTNGNSIWTGNGGSTIIEGNRCLNSTRSGIESFFNYYIKHIGNVVMNHFTIGISFVPDYQGECSANTVKNVGDIGIEAFAGIGGTAHAVVSSNTIEEIVVGQFPLIIPLLYISAEDWTAGSSLIIKGNTCVQKTIPPGAQFLGIQTQSSDDILITENMFIGLSAITINNGSNTISVMNNRMYKTGDSNTIKVLSGANHIIRNNDTRQNGTASLHGNPFGAPIYIDDTGVAVNSNPFSGSNLFIP